LFTVISFYLFRKSYVVTYSSNLFKNVFKNDVIVLDIFYDLRGQGCHKRTKHCGVIYSSSIIGNSRQY